MGIALKKKAITLTAEERAGNAKLDVENALGVFSQALATMDAAIADLITAEDEAFEESNRHAHIAYAAQDERIKTTTVAAKFRALLEV